MSTPQGSGRWIVRTATLADADGVNALLEASYSTLLPADYDAELLKAALPQISKARPELLSSGTWFVVEKNTSNSGKQRPAIVGCGGWSREPPIQLSPDDKVRRPHVRHVATDPSRLRQGIGRALWNKIWDEIYIEYGGSVEMEVFSTRTAAPFYSSLGFVTIDEIEIPLGEKCMFPALVMRRPADP